ncbi:MAG: transporter, ATP-binding protein [Gemmatimonadetes bacterium]|nr:transporter, ATP-binding protein [Gemmatimonadota bacterium]
MSASGSPIARLDRVTKRYGDIAALHDVSLELHQGVTALLGPNGAGKTTAVKLLLGLAKATSGSVTVRGGDPRLTSTREQIGAMLQVGKVPETLRVREHVDLFRHYYPKPMPAADAIEMAGLTGLADRKFGQLSGGERQRVLFALALCGDPALLVLDEPTVGFDVETRRAFWDRIAAFARSGRSVLLTTHYLEEADALADRIVVIDRGRIVADGTPIAIKSQSATKIIRCTTSIPVLDLQVMFGVQSVRLTGGRAELLVSIAEPVVRELLARDPGLSDLEVAGAGLEEAFLAITHSNDAVPA